MAMIWKRLREAAAVSTAGPLVRGETEEEEQEEETEPTEAALQESEGPLVCSACGLAECTVEGVERVREAKLSSKQRKGMDKSKFAIPEKGPGPGSYPIPDADHAHSALSLVAQHGTPEEQSRVKAYVRKHFPNIDVSDGKTKESDVPEASMLERLESLESSMSVFQRLREAKPAAMTPTFSTPARVQTNDGREGYAVVLIREGRGNSEHDQWYTGEAIKELCESGVCEGMQAFANHPDYEEEELRPERDIKEIVGTYADVKFAESGGKARAEAVFVPLTLDENHSKYGWVVTLAEAAIRSNAPQPICGISLYGLSAGDDCERPDGTFGRMVNMIRPQSGDIVTSAGAGGGFIRQLMESARALRNRARKELLPMQAMAYQNAVREAAKRVREASTDDERESALAQLEKIEGENIDNAPDSIEQLREAAPKLVQEIEQAATAADGKTLEELREENSTLKNTLSKFTNAIGVTEALREAGVEDSVELRYFAGKARERGLSEAEDIKDMVESERAYEKKRADEAIASMREAFQLDDSEVEGAVGRVPVMAAVSADGGVSALRESGLPIKDAE